MKDDGGPAFPGQVEIGRRVEYDEHLDQNVSMQLLESHSGMTLRDYFAAKAMVSMLGNTQAIELVAKELGRPSHEVMALAAYKTADAMLAEREKSR